MDKVCQQARLIMRETVYHPVCLVQWPTQPSIPPGSVNEYHLRLGRQRQVRFIPLADENTSLWRLKRLVTISTYRRYINKCIYLSIYERWVCRYN